MKKKISLLLCILMLTGCLASCIGSGDEELMPNNAIAYVPLDDRPVNTDRVKYLVESAGLELRMPPEQYYTTVLDSMGEPHGGNTQEIIKWLRAQENVLIDTYVISLDQVFSGGLVASRMGTGSGELTDEDYETISFLANLASANKVIFLDTNMRLAATSGYMGYTLDDYYATRAYGNVVRKELTGSSLTVENVVKHYTLASDGKKTVSLTQTAEDGKKHTLTEEQLASYLAARERKLRFITELIATAGPDIDRLIVGVDDSSATKNIQHNERSLIAQTAEYYGVNYKILAACDELGMLGMASVAVDKAYGTAADAANSAETGKAAMLESVAVGGMNVSAVPVAVTYFGDGKDKVADAYTYMTLEETVNAQLELLGASDGTEHKDALQVLVLTQQTKYKTTEENLYAKALMEQVKANLDAGIPTAIIDASNGYGNNERVLGDWLLNYGAEGIDIASLLAFSCWNTVSNAVGTGLSNAVARYAYITTASEVTEQSNIGFLKTLTTALVKDISYKGHGNATDLTKNELYDDPMRICEKITASPILTGIGVKTEHGKTVTVSNLVNPWGRSFEARFDINIR